MPCEGGGEVLLSQPAELSDSGEPMLGSSPCSTELGGDVATTPAMGVVLSEVGVAIGRD